MRNVILSPVMKFNHDIKSENIEFTFNSEETGKKQNLTSTNFLHKLKEFLTEKKYPTGCESRYNTKYGIMSGHAFSLLEVKTVDINGETLDLVKIFNP